MKAKLLAAARSDGIPEGQSGLWEVMKWSLSKPLRAISPQQQGKLITVPPGNYTSLMIFTEATMHLEHGECVMRDDPQELNKHLQFMLSARGHVLITGLGLGCVTRGTLANPAVESVTVIEKSPDVLRLVQPHMPKVERLRIIHADAIEWVKNPDKEFDCAWHDLWTDENQEGASHLQVLHMDLICELAGKVPLQGAWAFPRYLRRSLGFAGVL